RRFPLEIRGLCCVAVRGRDFGEKSQKRIVRQDAIQECVRLVEQVTVQESPPSRANYFTGPDVATVMLPFVETHPLEFLLHPLPISAAIEICYAREVGALAHVALKYPWAHKKRCPVDGVHQRFGIVNNQTMRPDTVAEPL